MSSVFANGRSIVHAGDGLQHVAAPPDVCKTPSPGGPVPIPYVNVASDSDLARGTKGVKIEGNPVALASSHLSSSTGDEPGTAGGIISCKTKGKMRWATSSANVRFEGDGVARFMDVTQHNGNSFNTSFITGGRTGFAYGDDFVGNCPYCQKDADAHRIYEHKDTVALAQRLIYHLEWYRKQQIPLLKKIKRIENEIDSIHAEKRKRLEALKEEPDNISKQIMAVKEGMIIDMDGRYMTALKKAHKDAQKEADRLESEVKASAKRIAELKNTELEDAKKDLKKMPEILRGYKDGYMIGVLTCKCGTTFAAMSGETTRGFKHVVKSLLKWTLCDDSTELDDIKARARYQKGRLNADAWNLEERWHRAEQLANEGVQSYNPPGFCAASKLIRVATEAHEPVYMTEMWYSPYKEDDTVTVTYPHAVETTRFVSSGFALPRSSSGHDSRRAVSHESTGARGVELLRSMRGSPGSQSPTAPGQSILDIPIKGYEYRTNDFKSGETVPSCYTCQVLLPSMLCDKEGKC